MKFLSKEKISNHRYKTPEGYLVCLDAIIARTGKQDYSKNEVFKDSDDESIISIDRPANEVFSPETITSFENKPMVDEHPNEDINVDNHRDYSIGFVRDVRKSNVDGEDVLIANLIITDPEAISEIESGLKNELSCGYDCDILGDEDNLYQANIRGNHVALCKSGRAGIARIIDSKVEDSIMNDEEMINDADERLIKILEKIANDYNKAKISQSNARTSKSDLRYINTKHELASDLRNNLKNQWNKVVNTFNNTYQLVLGNEPSLYRVEEFKRLLKGEKHKNDSKEEEMIKDKLNNKPITIEIVFDSTEEAKNALNILQRKEQFIHSKLINNNSIEVKTTDLYYDELKKILKLYFVEKISIIDSIEDELTEPEQKYINEFEKELNYMQFKIVKIGKTFTGRTHYQVITKTSGYYDKDLNTFEYGLDKLSKKMKLYGIPVTYNVGLQKDGYISAGIDLDKQYVRDSINNEEKLLKDSIKARTLIKIYRFVKDSDKLKQLAYQFAQMGNYFDRANSANSRNILAREDDTKIAEFYNLGLQVYEQLKQEVNYLKNNTNASKRILYNETFDLLYDGSTRLHWIRDPKCKLLAKKLDELINAYKQYAVKR